MIQRHKNISFALLMNVRPPMPVSKDFTDIQDEYLQQENRQRGIVSLGDLSQEQPEIYLWQGGYTRLSVDAIVNAANSAMLGCFCSLSWLH